MRDWFLQLAPREQLILGLGTVLAVVIVGFSFVYRPLDTRTAALRESVDELSRVLVDLRRAAALGDGSGAAGAGGGSLFNIVRETSGSPSTRRGSTAPTQCA